MSHIQVELDSLHKATDVADLSGMEVNDVIAGLVKLWADCYRFKISEVSDATLRAKFKGRDLGATLAEFGFVERREAGWHVKGTGRYTRAQEARSKGGQAAKANLIPGAVHRLQPKRSRKPAEAQPKDVLGSASALDPKSEILNPKEEKKSAASPGGDPLHSDPWRRLVGDLDGIFLEERGDQKYRWQERDFALLKALRKHASDVEICIRFRRGLRREGFPRVEDIAGLSQHWNHFATDSPAPGRDARKAPVRAEDVKSIPLGEIDMDAVMAARGL